jgi:protein gp37
MAKTSIQWTDHSINPFRARDKATSAVGHFCVKLSAGCMNCYSSRLQSRFKMHEFVAKNRERVELFLDESKLQEVLRRKVPTKYFWCDMTDMFLEDYSDEWIDKCFAVMAATPKHTHQVLTKRAERMCGYINALGKSGGYDRLEKQARAMGHTLRFNDIPLVPWPIPSIHLGVSCEDQKTADERIPWLLKTPAAVRWVSFEPLLDSITLPDLRGQLHWAVLGGESGPKARECSINFVMRPLMKQLRDQGIRIFVKQLGLWPGISAAEAAGCSRKGSPGKWFLRLNDKKGGDWSEWPTDLRIRQFPLGAASQSEKG